MLQTRPPLIVPTDQQPPPDQTVWGTLEMIDPPETLNRLPGDPLLDQLLWKFDEYLTTFGVGTSDPPDRNLFCCDPLTVSYSDPSVDNEPVPAWLLNMRTCAFANVVPKLTFQPVKPPGVSCRILILHVPRTVINSADGPCPHQQAQVPLPNELGYPTYRTTKIEWDCQQPISLTLPAWSNVLMRPMTYPNYDVGNVNDVSMIPYENISGGLLLLRLAQRPMPGSIYPTSFNINVFKSYTEFDPVVLQNYYQAPSGLANAQRDGYVI